MSSSQQIRSSKPGDTLRSYGKMVETMPDTIKRATDDLHRLVNFLGELRILIFLLIVLSSVAAVVWLANKAIRYRSRKNKRNADGHGDQLPLHNATLSPFEEMRTPLPRVADRTINGTFANRSIHPVNHTSMDKSVFMEKTINPGTPFGFNRSPSIVEYRDPLSRGNV